MKICGIIDDPAVPAAPSVVVDDDVVAVVDDDVAVAEGIEVGI